jgi:hypothetical protein
LASIVMAAMYFPAETSAARKDSVGDRHEEDHKGSVVAENSARSENTPTIREKRTISPTIVAIW